MTDSQLFPASRPRVPAALQGRKTAEAQLPDRQPDWFPLCWVLPHVSPPKPDSLLLP